MIPCNAENGIRVRVISVDALNEAAVHLSAANPAIGDDPVIGRHIGDGLVAAGRDA